MKSIRDIFEKNVDYEIRHKTYSDAISEIEKFCKNNGYTLDDESDPENIRRQLADLVGSGPRRPPEGKTNKFSFELYKNNKKVKKMLHAQIYNTGTTTPFELNMYIL